MHNIAGILTGKIENLPMSKPEAILVNGLSIFYFVVGVVAVVTIIIAGYYFVVGGNNPSTVSKAKTAVLYSVIGLIIIIVAFAITRFVIGNI